MAFFEDLASGLIPTSLRYIKTTLGKVMTDLTQWRKPYRSIFMLTASGSTIVFAALIPTVFFPDSVGHYLNNIFSAISTAFGITADSTVLSVFSTTASVAILGSTAVFSSKHLYRSINFIRTGHTNSLYNFDENDYHRIALLYQARLKNIRIDLIVQHVKENIAYMISLIHEKDVIEQSLKQTLNKRRIKNNQGIITPNENLTKQQIKVILELYCDGDDSPFEIQIKKVQPAIQKAILKSFIYPGLSLCAVQHAIELRYPDIPHNPALQRNWEYFKKINDERRLAIGALEDPVHYHPLQNILESQEEASDSRVEDSKESNPDSEMHFDAKILPVGSQPVEMITIVTDEEEEKENFERAAIEAAHNDITPFLPRHSLNNEEYLNACKCPHRQITFAKDIHAGITPKLAEIVTIARNMDKAMGRLEAAHPRSNSKNQGLGSRNIG